MQARNDVVPVPVFLVEGVSLSEQLDTAVGQSAERGLVIRALLVTNPDNPTGVSP